MPIASVETRVERLPLSRPYTITFRTVSEVEIGLVILRDDRGRIGLGAASPEPHVTGETNAHCQAALEKLQCLVGADVRALPTLARTLAEQTPGAPAARAAGDMALHDLLGQTLGVPLGTIIGRAHERLPTSVTIGIMKADEAIREADEYLGRGFRILKVKIGRALEEDIERVRKLREHVGSRMLIRADANQGYTLEETRRFFTATETLGIEFLEQPVKANAIDELRALPPAMRALLCADESLLAPADALRLAVTPRPAEIFNIKLMKCGGIRPALAIATIAETAGMTLMWGCMDESRIGIAAALHAALASPATRYLDLDGSLDLARDVADGGFVLEDGFLRPTDGAGLGVTLI